jgi:hypothetical protein
MARTEHARDAPLCTRNLTKRVAGAELPTGVLTGRLASDDVGVDDSSTNRLGSVVVSTPFMK